MRWRTRPPLDKRLAAHYARVTQWHSWFAWFPVRVENNTRVWLETVERKYVPSYSWHDDQSYWEYRLPPWTYRGCACSVPGGRCVCPASNFQNPTPRFNHEHHRHCHPAPEG